MKKILLSLLAAATVMVFSASAYAYTTASATMNVSLTGVAAVTVSATDLNFGDVPISTGNLNQATSSITVTAPTGVLYAVTLDCGQHYGVGGGNWRGMSSGGNTIIYDLYRPAGGAWGDSGFADTYPFGTSMPGTGTGAAQSYTVTGELLMSVPAAGNYSDVVTVTVYY